MSRHWMKMYWADYLADTMHLSQGQHGAYLLLIAHYWNKGELLVKHCYSIARATTEQERSNVDEVLEQFFARDGDRWVSRRVEQELSEAAESYRRRAEAGAKGGSARASRNVQPENGEALPKQSCSNAVADGKQPEPDPEPEPESTTGVVDGGPASPPSSEEKPAKERKRKTKMPDDFAPNETGIRYANERGVHIAEEIQRMRNWAESNGVLRLEWQATWRTWCDKAVEFGRAGKPAARDQRPEKFDPTRYVNDPAYAAELDRRNGNSQQQSEGGGHGCVIDAQSRRVA